MPVCSRLSTVAARDAVMRAERPRPRTHRRAVQGARQAGLRSSQSCGARQKRFPAPRRLVAMTVLLSGNCSCYVLIDSRATRKSQATPRENLFLSPEMRIGPICRLVARASKPRGRTAICVERKKHGPHLPDPRMARPAVALHRRNGTGGARSLCPSAGRVPHPDRRDHHPDRRVPDRRDHGRPVARNARSTCSACSRGAASPSAGTRRPARGRTASPSIAAPSSTTGPKTTRRWARSSPMC